MRIVRQCKGRQRTIFRGHPDQEPARQVGYEFSRSGALTQLGHRQEALIPQPSFLIEAQSIDTCLVRIDSSASIDKALRQVLTLDHELDRLILTPWGADHTVNRVVADQAAAL